MTIPIKLRSKLSHSKFYKQCCITGRNDEKIEWHHNLIFGGNQIQAEFCILPLLQSIHRDIVKYKERCDWIMWNRASFDEIKKYSKAIDYFHYKKYLDDKYGIYREGDTTCYLRLSKLQKNIPLQK